MMRRRIMIIAGALVVTVSAMAGFGPMTAYAVEGWTNQDDEWKYLDGNDVPLENTWKQSRDAWFYLGGQGIMLKDCFIEQGTACIMWMKMESGLKAHGS
ncbi:MAG: hypothetical protein LUH04_12200 [Clostridium sp.]|nr:hypothetical protein [Clostridium sp.]